MKEEKIGHDITNCTFKYCRVCADFYGSLDKPKQKNNWEELREFIGEMYLNGKISAESSGPIYAKMKELEATQ